MKNITVVIASLALWASGCASAPPAVGPAAGPNTLIFTAELKKYFYVDFQGIITHVQIRGSQYQWRAVAIAGDFGRQHTPLLGVFVPDGEEARRKLIVTLRNVTGKRPRCNEDQCFVAINGVSMRIRDEKNRPPGSPSDPHLSFTCLAPRLRYPPVSGEAILSELEMPPPDDDKPAHLPSAPAVAFFEIDNGMLSASRFEMTGFFKDDAYLQCEADCKKLDDPIEVKMCIERCVYDAECREFAAGVRWQGVTAGEAKLQLASDLTAWKWVEIPIGNAGPLSVFVANLANRGHSSSEHFAMNAKLLTNRRVPEVGLHCGKSDRDPCPVGPGPSAILTVPGCADNQWP